MWETVRPPIPHLAGIGRGFGGVADTEHIRLDEFGGHDMPGQSDVDIAALSSRLDAAQRDTHLAAEPAGEDAINDLIIQTRLERG